MTVYLRTSLLFGLLATGCSTPATLEDRLDNLGLEIANIFHVERSGEYRYDFTYDTDFPCSATLREHNRFDGTDWTRVYRFELSDLATGSLLAARERRRAISYYSEKTSAGGTRTFAPKKINAVRLRGGDPGRLQPLFDAVIAECREMNSFE